MKVALVSFYVMDSTAPLAKHISEAGVDVDLYSVLPHGNQHTFVFSFLNNKQPNGFINPEIVKNTIGERLWNYFLPANLKVFIYPDGRVSKFFFQDVYYAYKLASYLKKRDYDLVHILHEAEKFWGLLYFFLRKETIIQTLHEVTSHESATPKDKIRRMIFLIKKSIPIIFNSNISKERFIDFRKQFIKKDISEDNLRMIRFGLYETYQCLSKEPVIANANEIGKILYLGRIVPYKGVHFLIGSVKLLQEQYPLHLIIAGDGAPDFNFDSIRSYEFVNKFLSNEEIIGLIQECDFVVLPYISGSQSGIPMTVFAFNKPIIASNIAGFREVIDHMETGILVDNLSVKTLALSIEILLKNRKLKGAMANNIEKKYSSGEFSWKAIAERTIAFYKEQIEKIENV